MYDEKQRIQFKHCSHAHNKLTIVTSQQQQLIVVKVLVAIDDNDDNEIVWEQRALSEGEGPMYKHRHISLIIVRSFGTPGAVGRHKCGRLQRSRL